MKGEPSPVFSICRKFVLCEVSLSRFLRLMSSSEIFLSIIAASKRMFAGNCMGSRVQGTSRAGGIL